MGHATPDCQALLKKLDAFLDSELEEAELADLRHHLEVCQGCVGRVDFERNVKDLVRRRCSEDVIPDGLIDRLREAIRAREG